MSNVPMLIKVYTSFMPFIHCIRQYDIAIQATVALLLLNEYSL